MVINSVLIIIVFITFLTSIFITLFLIPNIKKIAIKNNLLDYPDVRKQRSSNKVRLGGLSLIICFLISLVFLQFLLRFNNFDYIFSENIIILVIGSILYFTIGFIDDLKNLKPWPKLFLQFIFGSILWSQGINIQTITLPLFSNGEISLPNTISLIFTICWVAAITNSINWLDGLDGLAVGVSGICFVPITILNFQNGNYDIAISSIIIFGSCLGFLRYNYKPSEILMGDGGSYFLGINLSIMSILASSSFDIKYPSNISSTDIACSLMIIALPLFDLLRVISTRMINGFSPFFPDRRHLHHKLVDSGIKEETAVNILYMIAILTGSIVLIYKGIPTFITCAIFIIVLLIYKFIIKKNYII